MFKSISNQFGSILVSLLSIQGVCSALAIDNSQIQDGANSTEENQLVARTPDHYTVVHKWGPVGPEIISPATGVGLVISSALGVFVTWYVNQPDKDKICGRSAVVDITDGGIDYQYYAYSYTTGDSCDSSQRTKTLADTLSDAMDYLHSIEASSVCIDLDHEGTWHGVLGLATKSSGESPRDACAKHHAGAKRDENSFLESGNEEKRHPEIEAAETNSTKRDEGGLVKRASISVTQSNKQSGGAVIGRSNKSQQLIAEIGGKIYEQSYKQNCAGVQGSLQDSNGVTVNYYYIGGGDENCDTTAEIKTIVKALDDSWDGLRDTSALCMTMQHGSGTWRGYLGLSTIPDAQPAVHMCD